ncbi:MAG TPA: polysaccharide lyase family protein [Planctomycetota bacterium]|nr:polysaccharide lyase family protein [Planctomycetota bacterium]
MKTIRAVVFLLIALIGTGTCFGADAPPVTVVQDAAAFTLSNGTISARISRRSGDLLSFKYNDAETLGNGSGHPGGYWSHSAAAAKTVDSITIDPKNNGGERGEVSVKGFSQGAPLGNGPGGSVVADIEIRYALSRGAAGLYTYCIFDHKADYPATSIGEARFAVKLNGQVFDWMTIDAKRNKQMPTPEDWDKGTQLNMKEARRLNTGIYKGQVEHKYDYSAIQFDIPAFGWSSTQKKIGLWFINPTIEYLSGGATKVELTGHLDNNAGAAPTLLNYWRGSHYGGSSCEIAQGEAWTKVVGPFMIYCNAAPTPDETWKDALSQAKKEADAWPYEWVSGVDYPHKAERATVAGQLTLNDAQAPTAKMSNVLVGLAWPDYTPRAVPPSTRGGEGPAVPPSPLGGEGPGVRGRARSVDWQQDAKHYEFWTRADEQGRFTIPNVRAGTYTLRAIADGVLGEFVKTNIAVKAGDKIDLGTLEWKPVRFGTQLWEIGIPNRSAEEFLHGDHYWQWGLYNDYPKDFPNDVNFVIGKSDFHKDWNYCQCPRADKPAGTTWTVTFDLPDAPHGKATLRLAIAASSARGGIQVAVNDKPAGSTGPLPYTATINRDGIRGLWQERDVSFDAGLMKAGTNTLTLTIAGGNAMNGVEYDYLRLEVEK